MAITDEEFRSPAEKKLRSSSRTPIFKQERFEYEHERTPISGKELRSQIVTALIP
ncbi:hypothetical protein TIFTF001_007652 [Ficus carica]|uniref:Uncharacterized protein n=1 Tax=Ficus carica TaxID=3494 RepID=A0AA87ZLN2_FICCA|nr:hypothetical protein TIFTF001_007652 [Ficus carica]